MRDKRGEKLVTIFTIPKPFVGHIGVIQRNAIESWVRLCPPCEIILCGDEEGVAEIAAEFNLRHLPNLARNEFGTPFLHSAFDQVRRAAQGELLCYVNADIMLLDDFRAALAALDSKPFLMVGQRWDIELAEPWNFRNENWQERLQHRVASEGEPHSPWGVDYFVFPRHGVIDRLPPFVVGRPGWDNWVIYNARRRGVRVIDASPVVRAIHQNHDYEHVPLRTGEKWTGPEAQRQVQLLHDLMDGCDMRFAIIDATHTVSPSGIHRRRSLRSLRREWRTLGALRPGLKPLITILNPLVMVADWIWMLLSGSQRCNERA